MPPSIVPSTTTTASSLLAVRKRDSTILFLVIFCAVLSLTPLLVLGQLTIGISLVVGVLAALSIAILVVRWPKTGLFVTAGCVVLVEEGNLRLGPIFTDRLYIFNWPPSLEGLFDRPIGFLFLFILGVLIVQHLIRRQKLLQGGALLVPFLCYLLCVAVGVVHGLATGGTLRIIVLEVRPFWYLFVSYLLAYNLITQKKDLTAFFWIVILGAGVKSIQGMYILVFVVHGDWVSQGELMAHEESFFFAALILLVILYCLHHRYRGQLIAALLVLPTVVIALVTNQRRADYIALLVGILVAWSLVFVVKPRARKQLFVMMLICASLGGAYVLAFGHSDGGFASPARAIVAVFSPDYTDTRDVNSNLYRYIENYDLTYTVKHYPVLGVGFGIPFLQPLPLTDLYPGIVNTDQYYNYIPHNTIYWIWMRLGPIGYLALWYLFGAIIVPGCLIVRQLQDRYLQLVAIYVVAITFMEIIVAFADYQLFFYRNVIYLGLLVGMLMKLPMLDGKPEGMKEGTNG